MYDLGCMLVELRPFVVLDGLPCLYGLKYDSTIACRLPLYLCSYKLVGSTIVLVAFTIIMPMVVIVAMALLIIVASLFVAIVVVA